MATATITFDTSTDDGITVALGGEWLLGNDLPGPDSILDRLRNTPKPDHIKFDTANLGTWDTGLITAIINITRSAQVNGVAVDETGLPEGARKLIALAFAVKEREGARRQMQSAPFLATVGEASTEMWRSFAELVTFVGETVQSLGRLMRGKAGYMKSDLVAVAMIREMAPIMTAIIMAGRTGAAYAAQLGTMKVNEEIDALTTLGIDPIDFLVLPRLIALIIMMPLLTMCGNLMGILGGMTVGLIMLDVSFIQYTVQTIDSVGLNSLLGGLFKCIVYGSLVAIAGCQQGMVCGNSAMAVGQATTKAVVMSIVLIVVAACILTVIYVNLGI